MTGAVRKALESRVMGIKGIWGRATEVTIFGKITWINLSFMLWSGQR